MDIEHQLTSAFEKEMGSIPNETTHEQYEEFKSAYEERAEHHGRADSALNPAAEARYGIAAYIAGVHLISCGQEKAAATWLRDAAECDIGDAAYRLAEIYESEAAADFNREIVTGVPADSDEKFRTAYYWYGRAALAGYAGSHYPGAGDLGTPVVSLDCCSGVRARGAEEEAGRQLIAAQMEADKMLRAARADVQMTVDSIRMEIRDLSSLHERLTNEIREYSGTLHIFRQLSTRTVRALPLFIFALLASWFSPRRRARLARVTAVYETVCKGAFPENATRSSDPWRRCRAWRARILTTVSHLLRPRRKPSLPRLYVAVPGAQPTAPKRNQPTSADSQNPANLRLCVDELVRS